MSILTKVNTPPMIQRMSVLAKFILGFALIYGTLEALARLLGDVLPTENALLITGAVLAVTLLVERGLFTSDWQAALHRLGLGWSGWPALGVALLISALQLACYPLITWLTGYRWTLPPNFPWTLVGIFAFHGVAEEVLYRRFSLVICARGGAFGGPPGWRCCCSPCALPGVPVPHANVD